MTDAGPFLTHTFANGLTLVAEKMPGVRSAAMVLTMPAGAATDPVERCGSATVLAEMAQRGAGDRDARQFTEHLDGLGLTRGDGVGTISVRYTAAGLAANVMKALPAFADLVQRPHLKDDAFGPSRDLAQQALEGLADDPQRLAMVRLREWSWPGPLSRNPMGEPDHLAKLTAAAARDDFAERWQPNGSVISLAGDVDFGRVVEEVGQSFGDWSVKETPTAELTPPPGPFHFEEQDSQQTHIALHYPTVSETADDYMPARLAIECLSGGMSGRLFDRIREKQGLCYSVFASYVGAAGAGVPEDLAGVFCYAGTSNERAQATLDALAHELHDLANGVTADELQRAKVGLKAGVVMSGESSSSRATALNYDWTVRGRLRTLDEIVAAVDAVDLDTLNKHLARHPAGPFDVVLIGPKPLAVPSETRRSKEAKTEQRIEM